MNGQQRYGTSCLSELKERLLSARFKLCANDLRVNRTFLHRCEVSEYISNNQAHVDHESLTEYSIIART